jgi:hypothetical protein
VYQLMIASGLDCTTERGDVERERTMAAWFPPGIGGTLKARKEKDAAACGEYPPVSRREPSPLLCRGDEKLPESAHEKRR